MRVHELAKELDLASKDLLDKLHALGVEAKSHMSNLDEDTLALVKDELGQGGKVAPEAPTEEPVAEGTPTPEESTEPAADVPEEPPAEENRDNVITLKGAPIVKELAGLLGVKPNQLIAELMGMNVLASITQRVELKVAAQVAQKHGFRIEHEKKASEQHTEALKQRLAKTDEEAADRPEDLLPRPPVVVFLGHVDHGKTSLMDRIRDTSVVAGESGGITQHIGAYSVETAGRTITFLDTPGHAAFTAMRARGANLTDIAVIVIAADDGIMPQTREAISHAQAAGVSLIVAINKMDLPAANADRVKQQLQAEGMQPEDWGGETICVPVSAETGEGLDALLEMLLLQSEMLELKANPQRRAQGFVVEAQLEPGMGPTVNMLVTSGTLKVGDALTCGKHWGRVRALISDRGAKIKAAGPSTPIKCLGLSGVPEAGAEFRAHANDRAAKSAALKTENDLQAQQTSGKRKASLDALFAQLEENEKLELRLILKADTQGSVEAIIHALDEIKSDKISINFVLTGTGNITANDVMLASASDAVALGFHVGKEPGVDASARHEGVEVRLHQVIYEMIDEVREAMTGLLAPELREMTRGRAQIKQVFSVGKTGKVAGCIVLSGTVRPTFRLRVHRKDEVLFEGGMASLKHFQDSVGEVRESQECGVMIDGYTG